VSSSDKSRHVFEARPHRAPALINHYLASDIYILVHEKTGFAADRQQDQSQSGPLLNWKTQKRDGGHFLTV
jgi:hypothetical protein